MSARVRRRVCSALALTATAIVGGIVHANAPPGQYYPFDRTATCISDQQTKLTWIRNPITSIPSGTLTFSDAATTCGKLGATWRVPSVNELETLVDEVPHYELEGGQLLAKAIDANAFPGTPVGSAYWTSSVVPGGGNAWVVNFQDGTTAKAPQTTSPLPVRCVSVWGGGKPAACPL
jgi:Protein of unknown function (DUF1566)